MSASSGPAEKGCAAAIHSWLRIYPKFNVLVGVFALAGVLVGIEEGASTYLWVTDLVVATFLLVIAAGAVLASRWGDLETDNES